MQINHNLASLNAYNQININLKGQSKAMSRISSGVKIASAADSPDGITKSESFKMQLRGLQMSQSNLQDGVSMLQTVDGGLSSINDMLTRMKELTVQSGGINSSEDKDAIQIEIGQLSEGISDAVKNTDFNGLNLLNGSTTVGNINISSAGNAGETIPIPKYNLTSGDDNLLDNISAVDITKNTLDSSLQTIDSAISKVLDIRSNYAAVENRLQSTADTNTALSDVSENANSNISDADMTEEIMNYSKFNILAEAGNAIMAQTNKLPQDVLKLLQNVL